MSKIQVSLISDKNNGHFTRKSMYFFSDPAQFFLELEMFQKKIVDETQTYILCTITFFEIRTVYTIM